MGIMTTKHELLEKVATEMYAILEVGSWDQKIEACHVLVKVAEAI